MHHSAPTTVDARGLRIGIAISRYHHEITQAMHQAAQDTFLQSCGERRLLHSWTVPGSFELVAVCRALAVQTTRSGRPAFDALVALGCIITGETSHDQYIAHAVAQGLTAISVDTGTPIAFGVLTCQSLAQARARSIDAGPKNKGAEAMMAAIEAACTIRSISTAREFR